MERDHKGTSRAIPCLNTITKCYAIKVGGISTKGPGSKTNVSFIARLTAARRSVSPAAPSARAAQTRRALPPPRPYSSSGGGTSISNAERSPDSSSCQAERILNGFCIRLRNLPTWQGLNSAPSLPFQPPTFPQVKHARQATSTKTSVLSIDDLQTLHAINLIAFTQKSLLKTNARR